MEKSTIYASIMLPKEDLTGYDYSAPKGKLRVVTEFNPETNNFTFKAEIPKYIFEAVKDSDDKYLTNPPKKDYATHGTTKANPKFTKYLNYGNLGLLLSRLEDIITDAMATVEKDRAESDKFLAVLFTHGHSQQRDDFNHADMGHKTSNMFQFFPVYKIRQNPNSLNRYIYKSNKRIEGAFGGMTNAKNRSWHFYSVGALNKYQLIPWTQEREDFLQGIQDKFVNMNQQLETFLGNLDEDKIMALMANTPLFLTS